MHIEQTAFDGLVKVYPTYRTDSRGGFEELYKETGFPEKFVQDNLSTSYKGVVRGLHFQRPPHEQGKLVYCLSGHVWDVAVDLRPGSKTYLKHYYADLLPEGFGVYIPPGFAHGFMAMDYSTLFYKCTKEYSPAHEGGVRWDDPKLGIHWPKLPFMVMEYRVSDKDRALPRLK